MSIDSYDLKTNNYTVNWLYKEKVVSKEEIIKTGKFDYNLDEDKFNFIKKEKTSKTRNLTTASTSYDETSVNM